MASPFDDTEFIDTEFQVRKAGHSSTPQPGGGTANAMAPQSFAGRPPTREEIESKVNLTQQRLAELKHVQEELERERATLEEARRRRVEFQTGREEMVQHLTRGTALLEEAEFGARRDAEQMAKTLGDLRSALAKVQGVSEAGWTQETYHVELTRALTAIENARMEWNAARLKWPVLNSTPLVGGEENGAADPAGETGLHGLSFFRLARLGLAFHWPLVILGTIIVLVLLVRR